MLCNIGNGAGAEMATLNMFLRSGRSVGIDGMVGGGGRSLKDVVGGERATVVGV